MSLSATSKLFLFSLLPALSFGQTVNITPAAPVAAVGNSITITADRPVTFHLSGVGAISVTKGLTTTYTAPATITAPHTLAGCMTTPSDSVFNTRIDNLPVNTSSGSWTPFVIVNGVSFSLGWGINVVDQTTPLAAQQFADTPQLNGVPFPALSPLVQKRENGSLTTDGTVDHHLVVLNQSTCQFYETNQSGISIAGCPTCTAQSGWTYNGTSYGQPTEASADPAGLPLAPLTLHLSELKSGAVMHALRFTACAECIGGQAIWPAITSNGLQSGAPPLGARFRLKASVDISSFPPAAYTVLTALKRYGMILAGTGATGQISVATDVAEDETTYQQIQTIAAANLSYADFEVVDESSLQLAAGSYAVNPGNQYETPSNYATLTMTDEANPQNVLTVPIALQPVLIGTPDPTIVVQGGTATFQIPHWVTGTSNTATTWTISPPTGAGTITGDGVYTPPAVVTTAQTAMIQAVSVADKTATLRIYLTVIPSGGIRIDTGDFSGSQDTEGLIWSPDLGMEAGTFTAATDTPGAWGTAVNAEALSSYLYTNGGDIVYKLHVPNGFYQVGLSFGVGGCDGRYSNQIANQSTVWGPLNLQSQSALAYPNWDLNSATASTCRTPETVNLPAQVTNGILTFAVRASSVNGANSAALLNAVSIIPVNQLAAGPTQVNGYTPVANLTYTPQQFDPSCGQSGYNCQNAFQIAFATLAQAGGGTLQVPAGTFTINFPGVVQNVIGGASFSRNSLLVVPPNTMIQGHVAPDGTPDSVIQWQITSIPVFIFDRSTHSGMRNLHMSFTGTTAAAYPFGDVAMLAALGYNPTFPHNNQMSGGNSDMFTFAFVFDSDNCTFDHLLFDSATHDNAHIFNMAINMKGKGVISTGGGGLTQLAESNRVTNIQVYDFNNAFLICGQDNFLMQNISADRRGSIPNIAPGHLLYTSGTLQFDMSANITGALLNTNMMFRNLIEGPDTYSNVVSGGTLAMKFLNGAQINNVISQHPEGLIQTIYVDQNVTFSNMHWTSNYPLCANVPSNCATPTIYTAASPSNFPVSQNLTFQNITLVSTASPTSVMLMGDNLLVNGMNITTLPNLLPHQTATSAILAVKQSAKAVISGYTYTPVLTSYVAGQQYNTPFTGWNPTSNVNATMTMRWPNAITRPTTGSIVTPVFQSSSNNAAAITFAGY